MTTTNENLWMDAQRIKNLVDEADDSEVLRIAVGVLVHVKDQAESLSQQAAVVVDALETRGWWNE